MDSNNCFSKVIAHVVPLWHCAKTHLKTPQRQTVKSPAFLEALALPDNQLIHCI